MKLTRKKLKLKEHKAWYTANQGELQDFYKSYAGQLYSKTGANDRLGWFWSLDHNNPTEESTRIHTGIARLISKKMADVVTANGYEFSVEGDKEGIKHSRLTEILKANGFNSKLNHLIETNSWSGGTAVKISIDSTFNEPLIEVVNPENYEPVIYKGRIVEDVFIKRFEDEKNKKKYELHETYGTKKNSGAYIKYTLYELKDGKLESVPLATLEETKDLKDITIKGWDEKLSYYFPNRLPNSDLESSVIGESDYSGSEGLFNSLDEIFSTYQQEFRDSKLNRYFPAQYLMLDVNTGEYKRENALKTNHTLYSTGIGEDDKGKIVYEQGDLRSDKHEAAFKTVLMHICNAAGLSPITLGITGLESIMASAESQQEREKVSIRTREIKADILEDGIPKLLAGLLVADDLLKIEGEFVRTNKYEVNFKFNDYIIKSKFDKIEEVREGLESGVYDLRTAIEYVHDELSEDEQMEILINSKIERGITQFNTKEAEFYIKLFGPHEE